jgi:hypothetical protein
MLTLVCMCKILGTVVQENFSIGTPPGLVPGFHRSRDVRIDPHCHIDALPVLVCFISLHTGPVPPDSWT